MNEAEVVEGLRGREPQAQLAFLDHYRNELSEYLLRFRNLADEDVEQLVADVLYAVIDDPSRIDLSRGSIRQYLFAVTRNSAIDLARRKQTRLRGNTVVALDEDADEQLAAPEESSDDEEGDLPSTLPKDVAEAARQVIDAIHATQMDLEHVRLRVQEKFRPKEVAGFLGISEASERTRWSRLNRRIRDEWITHPALLAYAQQLGAEVPHISAH